MVVPPGIVIIGELRNVDHLIVEGRVDTPSLKAKQLTIAAGGVFNGQADVQVADIAGLTMGLLTARKEMVVRQTGHVSGGSRTRRLQVEEGGRLSGRLEMLMSAEQLSRTPSTKERRDGTWQITTIYHDFETDSLRWSVPRAH